MDGSPIVCRHGLSCCPTHRGASLSTRCARLVGLLIEICLCAKWSESRQTVPTKTKTKHRSTTRECVGRDQRAKAESRRTNTESNFLVDSSAVSRLSYLSSSSRTFLVRASRSKTDTRDTAAPEDTPVMGAAPLLAGCRALAPSGCAAAPASLSSSEEQQQNMCRSTGV